MPLFRLFQAEAANCNFSNGEVSRVTSPELVVHGRKCDELYIGYYKWTAKAIM